MSTRKSLLGKPGYAYSTLRDNERSAYLQLYETIINRDRIRVEDYPLLEANDISRLLACIDMDHPELFWMDGYQNPLAMNSVIDDSNTSDVWWKSFIEGFDFDHDGKISFFERNLAAARVALDADPAIQWAIEDELRLLPTWTEKRVESIQELFNEYVLDCKRYVAVEADDYHVLRHVFEYVAQHTSFGMRKPSKLQDIRSVFLNRESVCKGYAEAFQYLLLDLGIPCFTVMGSADVSQFAQAVHAWNYVLVDGQWNIVDITAGDWDLELKPELLPTISEKIRDRFVDYRCMSLGGQGYRPADILPYPPTGTTGNYFEREGYTLRLGDWVNLTRLFLKLFNRSESYIMVRCDDDFAALDAWMQTELTKTVKTCVAAGGSYESFLTDPKRFRETAKMVNDVDIEQTGWGDFQPCVEYVFPDEDAFVLTATGKPPRTRPM